MAALTFTVAQVGSNHVFGDRRVKFFDVTFDGGDYAAGGVAILPAAFNMNAVSFVQAQPAVKSDNTKAVLCAYDHTNQKLRIYATGTSADTALNEATTTVASGFVARLMVVGY